MHVGQTQWLCNAAAAAGRVMDDGLEINDDVSALQTHLLSLLTTLSLIPLTLKCIPWPLSNISKLSWKYRLNRLQSAEWLRLLRFQKTNSFSASQTHLKSLTCSFVPTRQIFSMHDSFPCELLTHQHCYLHWRQFLRQPKMSRNILFQSRKESFTITYSYNLFPFFLSSRKCPSVQCSPSQKIQYFHNISLSLQISFFPCSFVL